MAAGLLIFPGAQPSRSRDGGIIAAELRWYINETTTPAVVYQDQALSVPHAFPIVSDDFGRFPLIWADTGNSYSVNWSTAAPDSQSSSYDGLTSTTAADIALLDNMNALIRQAEDIYEQIVAANTGFTSTSTTEETIGLGVLLFETQSAKSYLPTTLVTVGAADDPDNWMHGAVESYDITTGHLYVDVSEVRGSGTFDAWNISLAGPVGPQGVGVLAKLSAAEILAGVDDAKYPTAKGLVDFLAPVAATVTGVQTPDCSNSKSFDWLLSGNITLNPPSATKDGTSGLIYMKQPAAGGPFTLTRNAAVLKGVNINLTLSTAANKVDALAWAIRGGVMEILGFTQDIA